MPPPLLHLYLPDIYLLLFSLSSCPLYLPLLLFSFGVSHQLHKHGNWAASTRLHRRTFGLCFTQKEPPPDSSDLDLDLDLDLGSLSLDPQDLKPDQAKLDQILTQTLSLNPQKDPEPDSEPTLEEILGPDPGLTGLSDETKTEEEELDDDIEELLK
ncbi:hypothetical protein WMY93_010494 [Mugilogobius chulae]|uniref:Uncharacterized protein n=1 Tax=Mugilogobius chulae TaxID=88201 RepID=A0AAW0P8R1_9GOBI